MVIITINVEDNAVHLPILEVQKLVITERRAFFKLNSIFIFIKKKNLTVKLIIPPT
jgi:hypothetical protein